MALDKATREHDIIKAQIITAKRQVDMTHRYYKQIRDQHAQARTNMEKERVRLTEQEHARVKSEKVSVHHRMTIEWKRKIAMLESRLSQA